MDFKQMQYLLAVYDAQSITIAAKRSFISPQALSKSIKTLETEYNTPILIHDGKKIAFTEFGLALVSESRKIIHAAEQMQNNLTNFQKASKNTLKIAAAAAVTHVLGYELFDQFQKAMPDVQLEIMEYADIYIEQMVLNDQCDLAFGIDMPDNPQVYNTYLISEHALCAVVSLNHPYANKKNITLADLASQPVLTKNDHYKGYLKLENYAQQHNVKLHYLLRTPDEFLWASMLSNNMGVGIAINALPMKKDFKIKSIPLIDNQLSWNIVMLTKKIRPQSPTVSAFVRFMLKYQDRKTT